MHKHIESTKGRSDDTDHLVSKRLKARRIMLGLSQKELGNAVDVSIQQVQKYEKATNRISSGRLYNFSKFLKVPVSYFFDKEDDSIPVFENAVAEDGREYKEEGRDYNLSEKEVLNLVRAYGEVKNQHLRKKILDLIKSMS